MTFILVNVRNLKSDLRHILTQALLCLHGLQILGEQFMYNLRFYENSSNLYSQFILISNHKYWNLLNIGISNMCGILS